MSDVPTLRWALRFANRCWLDRQAPATLYLTTISQAELFAGVLALPAGKRRTELQRVLNHELVSLFTDRILAFGERSAGAYAPVVVAATAAGGSAAR